MAYRPMSYTVLYAGYFKLYGVFKNIWIRVHVSFNYWFCIGIHYRRRLSNPFYQIRVISESCFLYSVGPGLCMELFAQKVCILRVRDCPFPQRINNKIIITKSTKRHKGWFFFLHSEETRGHQFTDARCIWERLLRKTSIYGSIHL